MSVFALYHLYKRTPLIIYGYAVFNVFCSDGKSAPKTVPFIPFSLQIAFNGFLVFLEEDRILLIFFCHNITFIYPSVYK